MQEIEFPMMVLMAHCLLRPAEAQNIRVCDVVLLDPEGADRAPGVWGIVALTAPKTRRLPSHTAVQHVLIEDVALADFFGWVQQSTVSSDCCEGQGQIFETSGIKR